MQPQDVDHAGPRPPRGCPARPAARAGVPAPTARSASGACTSWPAPRSSGATRSQHQPPCQAPCTRTNVLMLCASSGRLGVRAVTSVLYRRHARDGDGGRESARCHAAAHRCGTDPLRHPSWHPRSAAGQRSSTSRGRPRPGDADHHRLAEGALLGGQDGVPVVGLAVEDPGLAGAAEAVGAGGRHLETRTADGLQDRGVRRDERAPSRRRRRRPGAGRGPGVLGSGGHAVLPPSRRPGRGRGSRCRHRHATDERRTGGSRG